MSVTNTARNYRGHSSPRIDMRASLAPQRSVGRARFGDYVIAAVMLTAALVFYVYLHVSTLAIGYDLSRIRADQLRMVRENRALTTEVGSLAAPSRIRRIARTSLGMQAARKIERINEENGGKK